MEIFRVPKREVPVRVSMDNGQTLDGILFVATVGTDGRLGRVLDRLNDTEEEFLPLACGEDHLLLNKSGVMMVEEPEEKDQLDSDAGAEEMPVRVTLIGGTNLVGRLRMRMPPERARVLDYLNAAPRFIALFGENGATLIQRSYIMYVRTLASETR